MHYNPCGKAVANLRSGYRTKCRFFENSNTEVEIQWYKCVPGAPTLGYPSAISSLDWWAQPWIKRGVGEVFNAKRTYKQAPNIPGADGKRVCGTREDFELGGVYDPELPPMQYSASGLAVCCGVVGGLVLGGSAFLPPPGGVVLGGTAPYRTGPYPPVTGGVVLGGAAERLGTFYCVEYPGEPLIVMEVISSSGFVWTEASTGWTLYYRQFTGEYWILTQGFGGPVYRIPWEEWDGQGCHVFPRVFGSGPDTLTVCLCDEP